MNATTDIVRKALSLSAGERAGIARVLLQSLEISHDHDYETEWLDLAEKRRNQVLSGEVRTIDWSEVKSFVTAK